MTVFLIILAALAGVGLPLWLLHRAEGRRTARPTPEEGETAQTHETTAPPQTTEEEVCCGMHVTCEKDSLLAEASPEVEYFDDEELDRFAGRGEESYSPQEVEEFRDVLLTLIPTDIAPWARSIQLRGITLPAEVREELLMIVAEARQDKDGR